jgi:hypothetical protein
MRSENAPLREQLTELPGCLKGFSFQSADFGIP